MTSDPLRTRSPDVELSWDQVLGWRIRRHHLLDQHPDPVELTGALCGVQAQVMSGAALVVGIRSGAAPDQVEKLIWTDRRLAKTWAMRGTLHLLPAAEFPLWIAALRNREWPITPAWERYHGVTADDLQAITAAIPEALAGRQLTRLELAAAIIDATGRPDLETALHSGWSALLKPAANQGLLCQGPERDGSVTFVSPVDWLGDLPPGPEPTAALHEILSRFLDVHGPAVHEDFARWFGVVPKVSRRLFAELGDRLAVVEVDGHRAWMTLSGAAAASETAPDESVHLLPGFDPYVLAPLSHRDHTIPAGRLKDVSRTAGWISAVLVVAGRIAGTWTTESRDAHIEIAVNPFSPLDRSTMAGVERTAREVYEPLIGAVQVTIDR